MATKLKKDQKEKPEEQKQFDEALKRVWNAPPQHKQSKKNHKTVKSK